MFFLKIVLTAGGILSILKGINDGFVSSKSIEHGSWIRLTMGFLFIIVGVFLIYFADLFPPVTKFLRPFVEGILNLPTAMNEWVQKTAGRNIR